MIDENRASIEAIVHQTYMLDTNVFNHVLEEKISLELFAGCRLLVIGVQLAELRATPCEKKTSGTSRCIRGDRSCHRARGELCFRYRRGGFRSG